MLYWSTVVPSTLFDPLSITLFCSRSRELAGRHHPRSNQVAYEHEWPASCRAPDGVQIQNLWACRMYAGMLRIAFAWSARACFTSSALDRPTCACSANRTDAPTPRNFLAVFVQGVSDCVVGRETTQPQVELLPQSSLITQSRTAWTLRSGDQNAVEIFVRHMHLGH